MGFVLTLIGALTKLNAALGSLNQLNWGAASEVVGS